MNTKYIISLLSLSSILLLKTNPARALSINLYDGSGSPETQGWLAPGAIGVNPNLQDRTPNGIEVNTNTNGNGTGYFGYSNYDPTTSSFISESSIVNSPFPILDRNQGYSIFFDVTVNPSVDDPNNNRSSFSVIAISSDLKGIEIGFDIDSQIFAQNDGFTSGETANYNINDKISYELRIQGNEYQLFDRNNSTPILANLLRDYNFNEANSNPPLFFDPYEIPNFLFFGDSTDQASGTFTLGAVSVSTVPFNFSPTLGLALVGFSIWLRRKLVID